MTSFETVKPAEIEAMSFSIIESELESRGIELAPENAAVVKRVIHTTADFDYAASLSFSDGASARGVEALAQGCSIVTDTAMARAGINKRLLEALGGRCYNFIADEDVAREARERACTRSYVSMERAAALGRPLVFAIGNAPTALMALCDLMEAGRLEPPALIVGVPVGFVNVIEAKEAIMRLDCPWIVARGRKGGSNVAAAICNALLYQAGEGMREW